MGGNRKSKTDEHTTGVVLDLCIEELLHFGEGHNLIELAIDLGFFHAKKRAVQIDILPAGQFVMKTNSNFEQAADSSPKMHDAFGGSGDLCQYFQERGFPGAVSSDNANRLALLDLE